MNSTGDIDPPVRARIPADLEAPDRIIAGLSAHQLIVLASVLVPLYLIWQTVGAHLPLAALVIVGAPLAAAALALALGRRDGLSLDTWVLNAVAHSGSPHRLTPHTHRLPQPHWAPMLAGTDPERGRMDPLRLPVTAIGEDGVIQTGPGSCVVLVAAGTVTADLHTAAEQGALIGGYARWLNALSGPVQIVISARRADLGPRAVRVAAGAQRLPHPALAQAAIDHAEFLLDLAEDGDRLLRTITIACTATGAMPAQGVRRRSRSRPAGEAARPSATGSAAGMEAGRRAARTVGALAAIGARCRVLDGPTATAVLATAVDPFGPGDTRWSRTPPSATVTAAPHPAYPPPPAWRDPGGDGPISVNDQEPWQDDDVLDMDPEDRDRYPALGERRARGPRNHGRRRNGATERPQGGWRQW